MEKRGGEKQSEKERKGEEGMPSQPEKSGLLSQQSEHSVWAGTSQVGRTGVREPETRSEVPSPVLPTCPSLSVLSPANTYP